MIAEELQKQLSELGLKYWEGNENKFIRYWNYLDRGLDVFNKFKYYIGFPLAMAAIFPFMKGHYLVLALLVIAGLPILVLVGYYHLHKISRANQYVNSIKGDIFQFKPLELSIEQVNILKDIRENTGNGKIQ